VELGGQPEKTGPVQISFVPVPDDDMVRRQSGGEQPVNHRRNHGGAGAVDRPGGRKNLDTDHIPGGHQAAPGFTDGRFAGEIGDAAIDHLLNESRVRLILIGGV